MAEEFLAKERFTYDLGVVGAGADQIAAILGVVGFARRGRSSRELATHVADAIAAGTLLKSAVVAALATPDEFGLQFSQALARSGGGGLDETISFCLTSEPLGMTVTRDGGDLVCVVSHGVGSEEALDVREVDVMLAALGVDFLPDDLRLLPELRDEDDAVDFTRRWVRRPSGSAEFGVWVTAFDPDQFEDGESEGGGLRLFGGTN